MASIIQINELAAVVLTLVVYASLFVLTILQNRKNRPLVLGVLTVATFMGFLLYAYLAGKHTSQWILAAVETLIILTGLSVLGLVLLDVFRWASGRRARQTYPRP
jgi:Kef-type K+ transport system membrane component KefB